MTGRMWRCQKLSQCFFIKCINQRQLTLKIMMIIVFCWNNCSGYSQEKCFKCNVVFPKLSRLKKGQRVKGFWSQGRKKGTKGKVFEAEAVGRGWEMFPRFPFFYRGFKMFTSCPSFFNQDALGKTKLHKNHFLCTL